MKQTREPGTRLSPPPPLEANDQIVTGVITAGWAVALVVLLIIRDSLRADVRWWIWTCAAGLAMGLFGFWYLPRLKRSRARSAQSRSAQSKSAQSRSAQSRSAQSRSAQSKARNQEDERGPSGHSVQSAPRDNGSNTVSSTETPGRSTRS